MSACSTAPAISAAFVPTVATHHNGAGNGHGSGDRALKEAAVTWRDELRGTDVLARLEDRTFATLHPACEPDDAIRVIERLMQSTPTASCTAGIASWRTGDSLADLSDRAAQALVLAQRRGGVVLAG